MAKVIEKPVRQKGRAQTEALLLEAAEKIFSEVGYESATTRMIAQEAGINISLINRYFDGKYGLLFAVVLTKTKHNKNTPDYPMEANLLDEFTRYGEYLVHKYYEDLCLFRICVGQFLVDTTFLEKFREVVSSPEIDQELKGRLEVLAKKDKIKLASTPEKMVFDLETYVFGLTILDAIIHGKSEKEANASCREFIRNYIEGAKK